MPNPLMNRSYFENLPGELRTQLYTYLLDADFVPPDLLTQRRQFHTPILRVNRRTYHEAKDFLYRSNTFVILSTNWYEFSYPAHDDACFIITDQAQHIERFERATMRLDLELPWARPGPGRKSCLVVQQDLPRLLKMVRRFCLTRISQWRLIADETTVKINILASYDGQLPIRTQKAVLEPLKQLHYPGLRVALSGEVDIEYKEELMSAMMPQLEWVRAWAAEVYDHARSKLDEGMALFRSGNLRDASTRYSDAADLLESANINNPRIGRLADPAFPLGYTVLTTVGLVNKALALLHMRRFEPSTLLCSRALMLIGANQRNFPPEILSKAYCCKATIDAFQNRWNEGHTSIQLSLADNRLESDAVQAIRSLEKQLQATSVFSEYSQNRLLDSQTTSTLEPIVAPELAMTVSESLADEVYVLQRLGYTGDLLKSIAQARMTTHSDMLEQWIGELKEELEKFPMARIWFGDAAAAAAGNGKSVAPLSDFRSFFARNR